MPPSCTVAIAVGAFQDSTTGGFTLSNVKTAASGIYLHGFVTTLGVAVITSIVPGIVGFLVAYAIFTAKRGAVLRRCVITASGVFANFGGVPLAFLFIATLGSTGMVTRWLIDIGLGGGSQVRRIEVVLAGDSDQGEQGVAPGIGQRRSHPMRR